VKKRAATVLAKLQKREALGLLDDPAWAVRSGAAEGFGSIIDVDAGMMAALEQFEKAKDCRVSRPVWMIKTQARTTVDKAPPTLRVQFKELATP
jgi:hypothetical protein